MLGRKKKVMKVEERMSLQEIQKGKKEKGVGEFFTVREGEGETTRRAWQRAMSPFCVSEPRPRKTTLCNLHACEKKIPVPIYDIQVQIQCCFYFLYYLC